MYNYPYYDIEENSYFSKLDQEFDENDENPDTCINQNNKDHEIKNIIVVKDELNWKEEEEEENNIKNNINIINYDNIGKNDDISFNSNLNNLNDVNKEKKLKTLTSTGPTLLGRKKKNSNEYRKHNKYCEDNIIRKIKAYILSILMKFINLYIEKTYNGKIGNGIFRKELLKLNQSQIIESKYNNEFINKTLKEIFSQDISTKYNNYQRNHNQALIQRLLNENDLEKKKNFECLFNLTFLDCLLHIRGTKISPILTGIELLDNLSEKFGDDDDYLNLFNYYMYNLEDIIMRKKKRKKKNYK